MAGIWVSHLAVTGLNAKPAGLQKPATHIFQSKLCGLHIYHETCNIYVNIFHICVRPQSAHLK